MSDEEEDEDEVEVRLEYVEDAVDIDEADTTEEGALPRSGWIVVVVEGRDNVDAQGEPHSNEEGFLWR